MRYMKITLNADRKLVSLECEHVAVRFNGLSNQQYRTMLLAAGIELVFIEAAGSVAEKGQDNEGA